MDYLDTGQIEANNKLFDLIRNKKLSEDEKLEKLKCLLCEFPAPNVNAKDGNDNDNTPLHLAVNRHLFKIVKFLRHKDAKPTIKNRNGKSSLDLEYVPRHSLKRETSEAPASNENTIHRMEKYVVKFDFRNIEDWDSIRQEKMQGTFKILKIDNITEEQALKFMQDESFINFFNASTHLFLFVIEIEGKFEITEKALRPIENVLDKQKPIIMQWQSLDSTEIRILFKEPLGTFVHLNEDWGDSFTESQLIEEITPGNNLRFPLLLKALHFGFGGAFKGNLLETNFDVKCKIDTWRLIDYAAMSNDTLSLRFLLLAEWNLEELNDDNRRVLEIAAQYASSQSMAALLDLSATDDPNELRQSSCQWKLLELKDFQRRTLIEINIENGKVETLKFLIKCPVERDYKSLIQLAWNERKYDKMFALLEAAECPFPEGFRLEEVNYGELKEIVQDREDFHQGIIKNSHDKVQQYIETYPQLKIAYNLNNQSALNTALNAKQFEIYDLLERKGFEFGERECNLLTEKQREKLKKVRGKHFKKLTDYHIKFLLSISKLGDDKSYFCNIEKLYEYLNGIPYISTVLKVLEQSHIREIIFDFNHASIEHIDPTKSPAAVGYCDHINGCIYIGAKRPEEELLGTLAHEFTHFAVETVYRNECNPYKDIDWQTKVDFKQIVDCYLEESQKGGMDCIVSDVFTVYKHVEWPSELIVRINHLLARYRNDERELSKIKETYKELFEFYRERVHRTFVNYLEERPSYKNQRLNDLLQRLDEIKRYNIRLNQNCLLGDKTKSSRNSLMLISALPQLLKVDLYQSLLLTMDEFSIKAHYIFTTLNDFKSQEKVLEIRKSLGSDIEQTLIVDCSCEYNVSEIKLLETITDLKKIIFIAHITKAVELQRSNLKGIEVERIERNYEWSNLSFVSQKLILEKRVDFQGYKVALNELIAQDSQLAKQLPLQYLLSDKEICIGRPLSTLDDDVGSYVRRIFSVQIDFKNSIWAHSEEEMLHAVRNRNVILISAEPGLGKSTLLVYLSELIKKRDPTLWVAKFDLRNCSNLFKHINGKYKDLSAVEFLSNILLQLEDPLKKLLFGELLARKKVILMLDGLDEISSIHNEVVFHFLIDLKRFIGQLWLTSRPQSKNSLMDELAATSCVLDSFSEDQRLDFLIEFEKHFFKKRGITVDGATIRDNAERRYQGLQSLMEYEEFLDIPLHIRMAAESFDIENEETEIPGKFNLLFLYKHVIKRKFKIYVYEKKNNCDDIDILSDISFWKLHERLALQFLFPNEKYLFPFQGPLCEPDEIGRMGIAQCIEKKLSFYHRTYAEYFVGTYFARELINPNSQHYFSHIFCINEILSDPKYIIVRVFIDSILASETWSEKTYEWYGKLLHTSDAKLLYTATDEGISNVVNFLLKCLIATERTHIFQHFLKFEYKGQTCWSLAAANGKTTVLNVIWENYREVNQDDLRQLLLCTSSGNCACSLAIWYGHTNVLNWLMERGRELNLSPMEFTPSCRMPRLSKLLIAQISEMESKWNMKNHYTDLVDFESQPFYKNLLHLAASNNHWNIFELILEWFKDIELPICCVKNIFDSTDINGITLGDKIFCNSDIKTAVSITRKVWKCMKDKGVNELEFKVILSNTLHKIDRSLKYYMIVNKHVIEAVRIVNTESNVGIEDMFNQLLG